MKRWVFVSCFVTLVATTVQAQKWVELWHEKDTNFYAIQQAFYDYYENREPEQEGYWKLFKRWEHFIAPRVYPTGELPDPRQAWTAHQKFHPRTATEQQAANFQGNWQSLGLEAWKRRNTASPGNGRINAIAMHPTDTSILYVGSPSGGLWKSTDAGQSWTVLTDSLPVIGISEIAIHPQNPDTVYIATGDGDGWNTYSIGVLKSTDGGDTWDTTGLAWQADEFHQMKDLLIHPDDPSILLAGTQNGLYKTTDAGQNWYQVKSGRVEDMKWHPQDPGIVYAAGDRFFKSTDTAQSFIPSNQGLPPDSEMIRIEIGVTPDAPGYVYLLAANNEGGFGGLYRSVDTGNTFTIRSDTPNILGWSVTPTGNTGQGGYDLALAVSPTDKNTVYTGGINIWKSADGGQNWEIMTHWVYPKVFPYVHADIHTLQYLNDRLFTGTDGGVFKTSHDSTTWIDLSEDLAITQFYRMGDYPGRSDWICGGCQDNGSFLYNGGRTWFNISGGDGMECNIDYTDSTIIYTSTQRGGLLKSTNAGHSFTNIHANKMGDGAWITPYLIHPRDPEVLLAGYQEVWKSRDRGESWFQLSDFNSSDPLQILEISPSHPDYIYAATREKVYLSDDGGNAWTEISNGLPTALASVSSLAIHASDPEKVWVTFSGYTAGLKVYKTTDAGNSWTNVSGALPNLPVNCITYQRGSDEGIYIGTDVGIYYRDTVLGGWITFMDSFPNVIVRELDIHYNTSHIRAATYGRGIWESLLYSCGANTQPPETQFTVQDSHICIQEEADFIDQTLHCSTKREWQFEGGYPLTSSRSYPSVYYQQSGQFDVSLISQNPYGSDTVQRQNYITVHQPPPQPDVYQDGDTLRTDAQASSYQWLWYGSPVLGATNSFHVPDKDGIYTVRITDQYGCSRVSSVQTVSVPSQPSLAASWRVKPNPASDQLTIQGQNLTEGSRARFILKDVLGRYHVSLPVSIRGQQLTQTIDVKGYDSGIYLLHIQTERARLVKKVVIE